LLPGSDGNGTILTSGCDEGELLDIGLDQRSQIFNVLCSAMALASDFAMGLSSGWFITVRTMYLRAASPWAVVSGIVSDCSRRTSTVIDFECRSSYLSDLMSLS
jgi:hypothetical protein